MTKSRKTSIYQASSCNRIKLSVLESHLRPADCGIDCGLRLSFLLGQELHHQSFKYDIRNSRNSLWTLKTQNFGQTVEPLLYGQSFKPLPLMAGDPTIQWLMKQILLYLCVLGVCHIVYNTHWSFYPVIWKYLRGDSNYLHIKFITRAMQLDSNCSL